MTVTAYKSGGVVGTTMAVGTGVTAVPLPAPTALMPIGTLDTPGAGCRGGAVHA